MTTLMVILTYSSSMPIMYPIGCLTLFYMHWLYKTLLLKYYQKTDSFNQQLPQFSMFYIKLAIFLHILFSALMFSNEEILQSQSFNYLDDLVAWLEDNISYFKQRSEYPVIYRFSHGIGFMYILLVLFIILVYIFKKFSEQIFAILYCIICCGGLCRRQTKIEVDHRNAQH